VNIYEPGFYGLRNGFESGIIKPKEMNMTKYRVVVDNTAITKRDWHRLEELSGGVWTLVTSGTEEDVQLVIEKLLKAGGARKSVVREFEIP